MSAAVLTHLRIHINSPKNLKWAACKSNTRKMCWKCRKTNKSVSTNTRTCSSACHFSTTLMENGEKVSSNSYVTCILFLMPCNVNLWKKPQRTRETGSENSLANKTKIEKSVLKAKTQNKCGIKAKRKHYFFLCALHFFSCCLWTSSSSSSYFCALTSATG